MKTIFEASEIFQDIPGDPENVMMTIPPEIREKLGWKEGDVITIKAQDGKIMLSRENG